MQHRDRAVELRLRAGAACDREIDVAELLFLRSRGRLKERSYQGAALPSTHRLGRRATLEIAELAEEPLLLLRRDLDRASGSMPLAASLTSSHACCWKVPPRIHSSHWPRLVTASRSFPPMHRCLVALFVPCRWFTAAHRSEGGP